MKIKPELILINNNTTIYPKILITGSDLSFIDFMVDYFVNIFQTKKYYIDKSGEINPGMTGGLFSAKKVLFVLKNYSSNNKELSVSLDKDQSLIISSINNKNSNKLKLEYAKSKNNLVIECYSLNRGNKESILKKFIEKNNMHITSEIFWYIVDRFDNEYVFFIKQLELTYLFNKKINSVSELERIVFVESKFLVNKIFFYILENNKTLVNIFNQNIYSQSDFYIFLNSLKNYLMLISDSKNKVEALSVFPKYLFAEKEFFIKIYNQLDDKKILKIYQNIFKVEGLIRKSPSLYLLIGMRFLLNTKQIITS